MEKRKIVKSLATLIGVGVLAGLSAGCSVTTHHRVRVRPSYEYRSYRRPSTPHTRMYRTPGSYRGRSFTNPTYNR